MKKVFSSIIKKMFLYFGLFIFGFSLFSFCRADLLNDVLTGDEVGLLGTDSESSDDVGDMFFDDKKGVVVNLTNLLLRITTVAGVTMILFAGVKFVMAMGDEGKFKEARKFIVWVIVGIVLALSSTGIIALIESFSNTVNDNELSGIYKGSQNIFGTTNLSNHI